MPKIVDHAQRRLDLADAALALVASEGVSAVTTRAVAKKSGWTIGVINHYFKSRHDLLLATLRRASEIQGKVYKDLDEQNPDAMEKLHRLVESFLPLDERRLALTRIFLFFYAEGAAEETARIEIAGFLARWRNVVSSALTAAQEQGLIDPALGIETATLSLVGALDGLSFEAVLDPVVMEAIARPGFVDTCIDVAIGRTPASH